MKVEPLGSLLELEYMKMLNWMEVIDLPFSNHFKVGT